MYFSGTIVLDTSSETHINIVKPTKAFNKVLNFLTVGALNEKEEHETYTAISILQQVNIVMRKMGITNIIRLSKDDFDFYLDHEGREDDLKEALESFELQVDRIEASIFNKLELVLEHHDDNFSYLINIIIARVHPVGESPITIKIDGLINEFRSNGDLEETKRLLEMKVFSSQEDHDHFLRLKDAQFSRFTEEMMFEIKKVIQSEGINCIYSKKMIRPKPKLNIASKGVPHRQDSSPVYCGYYGYDDAFLYAWLWSDLMHQNHFHCHDVNIVDESGAHLMDVGAEGFIAGEGDSDLLNPETKFDMASETVDTESSFFGSFDDASPDGSSCGSSCGGGCGGD